MASRLEAAWRVVSGRLLETGRSWFVEACRERKTAPIAAMTCAAFSGADFFKPEFRLLNTDLMAPRSPLHILCGDGLASACGSTESSKMTHLRLVHSRPSAAVPTVRSWTLSFPIVAKLLRELFKQLLRPYRPELHYMRGPGPAWRENHNRSFTHGSGIRASVQHLKTDLTTSAPGTPPAGRARAAGLAPRPAAPSSARPVPVAGQVVQITRFAASRRDARARRPGEISQSV